MFRTITPILSVAIALFAYFFFTQPLFSEIAGIQAVVDEYSSAIERADEKNALLEDLIKRKNSFDEYKRDRLNALVPATVDEVRILVDLTELARTHNMLIGNIQVEKINDAADELPEGADISDRLDMNSFLSSDISFGLIGTYEQFKAFIQDVERSLVLMELVSLSFESGEGSLQQYDVVVRAFALPDMTNN
jgi:Tfp pilus assembly protein PilO